MSYYPRRRFSQREKNSYYAGVAAGAKLAKKNRSTKKRRSPTRRRSAW